MLFNVYTVGITSNQLEGPGKVLSFADDILVYRHGRDRQIMADSVQEELDRIGQWCETHNGKLHPGKACVLWCSLNNHAVRADMPTVSVEGQNLQRETILKYLGITFDRSLSGKDHITRIVSSARKGLSAVKMMAFAGMPQRILFTLFQALVLSVIDYGLGLLTLSSSQLHRLNVIQNEGMRTILGCTRDTATDAMRYVLDLPDMAERHRIAQVKAYLIVCSDSDHPLHEKVGRQITSRLKRGSEWMTEAASTVEKCCRVEDVRRGEAWSSVEDPTGSFTNVVATLGRECREWPEGAANAEIETLIEERCGPGDVVIFTDGSVQRGTKSGWAYSARIDDEQVHEDAGAFQLTTSSMDMEVKAITEALGWLKTGAYKRVIFVTDSMSTLSKVEKGSLYSDWIAAIKDSQLERITWIFCPGHAAVLGNERADKLAGEAAIQGSLTLDPPVVLAMVKEKLHSRLVEGKSHTLEIVLDKGVKCGEGRKCELRGPARRINNQLMMNTISIYTLRWTLRRREEQLWTGSVCDDADSAHK